MAETTSQVGARLDSFVHQLVVALMNLELHAADSEEVQSSLRQLSEDLRHLSEHGMDPVRVEFGDGRVWVEGQPQVGASLQAARLLKLAAERRLRALEFGAATTVDEILRLLLLLSSPHKIDAFAPATVERAFHSHGVNSVRAIMAAPQGASPSLTTGHGHRHTHGHTDPSIELPALRGYQELADCLQDSHVAASRGEAIALDRAAGVVEQAMHEMDREPSGLLSLAYYDDIDSFTVGHSVRVALLTLQVARKATTDEATLLKAGTAALLHDIGKSRIPQSVLFKRGPLDDEEWNIMGMHPRLGAEILIEQPDIDPSAIGAAFCHHMAPDDRGYPTPTLPFEPSAVSKLVRVVDVFEALTSVRPYKRALSPVEAYVIMHRSPGSFDQAWLKFFVDAIGLYPLGTRLRMSSGEYGMVIGHGPRRDKPRVKISHDADGNELADGAPGTIVIGDEVDGVTREIEAVVPRPRPNRAPEDDPDAPVKGKQSCC